MILVQLSSGSTIRIDPRNGDEIYVLDQPLIQADIRRVSLLNMGFRVDLPRSQKRGDRVWVETITNDGMLRGERVYLRRGRSVLRASLYYSDGRVVLDEI